MGEMQLVWRLTAATHYIQAQSVHRMWSALQDSLNMIMIKANDMNNWTILPEGFEFHRCYWNLTELAQEKVCGSINIACFISDIKEH